MVREFQSEKRKAGFTLVELAVASAIFVLITALLLQLFGGIAATSNSSQRRLEILKQAMGALDRLNFDLNNHIATGELTPLVTKNVDGLNDSIFFAGPAHSFGEVSDYRKLSIVGYGIYSRSSDEPDPSGWATKDGFSRVVLPLSWSDHIGEKLLIAAGSTRMSGDMQQVAPGVVRCEVAFQLWDKTLVASPPSDFSTVRALVVAVVALDKKAVTSLSDSELNALPTRFPDATDNKRPSEAWNGSIADLPAPVRETLHVYEQTIPLISGS